MFPFGHETWRRCAGTHVELSAHGPAASDSSNSDPGMFANLNRGDWRRAEGPAAA